MLALGAACTEPTGSEIAGTEGSEAVVATEIEELFQERLDELCDELGFIGATAAFVLPDGSEGSAATGYADPALGLVMTPEHRMPAGSIGKTIAAATALSMVNEGLLGLDDLASRWLSNETWWTRLPNHETMTLRHLLSHSGGLTDHVFDEAWRREARAASATACATICSRSYWSAVDLELAGDWSDPRPVVFAAAQRSGSGS